MSVGERAVTKTKERREKNCIGKPYLKGTAAIFTGAVISLVCRAPGSCSSGERRVFFYIGSKRRSDFT